jgi:hypothetical protein
MADLDLVWSFSAWGGVLEVGGEGGLGVGGEGSEGDVAGESALLFVVAVVCFLI